MEDTTTSDNKTVRAKLKCKVFAGGKHFEEAINNFLETIDNQTRFLNSKEVNVCDGKLIVTVWYLEALDEKSTEQVTKFGKK